MYKCDTGRKEKSGDVISQVTERGGGGVLHPFRSFLFTVI